MELERTHLLDDPFDLVVPAGHPLAHRAPVALEELGGQTWIGGTGDGAHGRTVRHSCRAAGFDPLVVFGSDDYNAVQAFVGVGLGVAMRGVTSRALAQGAPSRPATAPARASSTRNRSGPGSSRRSSREPMIVTTSAHGW
jgi:DNA-binding transcriptional LysR family regulator